MMDQYSKEWWSVEDLNLLISVWVSLKADLHHRNHCSHLDCMESYEAGDLAKLYLDT